MGIVPGDYSPFSDPAMTSVYEVPHEETQFSQELTLPSGGEEILLKTGPPQSPTGFVGKRKSDKHSRSFPNRKAEHCARRFADEASIAFG